MRPTATLALAVAVAASAAFSAGAQQVSISPGLANRLRAMAHHTDPGPIAYDMDGAAMTAGSEIRVVENVQYHYKQQELNYELTPGMTGEVVRIDSSGDADVRWSLGRRWLLKGDFTKVAVVQHEGPHGAGAEPDAVVHMARQKMPGTLGTWFDRKLGTNHNDGVYFQAEALENIWVTSMVGNFLGPGNAKVYTRPGVLGAEPGVGSQWAVKASSTVTASGLQQVEFEPFQLARGNHSFLFASNGKVSFSNSDSVERTVSARDDHLIIYSGHSTSDLSPTAGHGYSFASRHWDGIFRYEYMGMVKVTETVTTTTLLVTTTVGPITTTPPHTSTKTATTTAITSGPPIDISQVGPVYSFWSKGIAGDSFHMPPAWEAEKVQELMFYALKTRSQLSVPVHTFWNQQHGEYTFHMDGPWEGESEVGEPAFYAFREQLDGTQPVFDFYSDFRKNTFHMGDAWSGETKKELQFYAFPNSNDDELEMAIESARKDAEARVQAASDHLAEEVQRHAAEDQARVEAQQQQQDVDLCAQAQYSQGQSPPVNMNGNHPRPVFHFFHLAQKTHSVRMGEPQHCEVRRGGVLFWAWPHNATGLVPIYAQGDAANCKLGRGNSCNHQGPLFYAFHDQAPGIVPIYDTWDQGQGESQSNQVLFFAIKDNTDAAVVEKDAQTALGYAARLFETHAGAVRAPAPWASRWGRAPLIAVSLVATALACAALLLVLHRAGGSAARAQRRQRLEGEPRGLCLDAADVEGSPASALIQGGGPACLE